MAPLFQWEPGNEISELSALLALIWYSHLHFLHPIVDFLLKINSMVQYIKEFSHGCQVSSISYQSSLFIHSLPKLIPCTQQKELCDSLRISLPQGTLAIQPAYNRFQYLPRTLTKTFRKFNHFQYHWMLHDIGVDVIINDIVIFYQRQRLILKVNFFWFLFCWCKHFAMLIKMSPAFIFFQTWIHFFC